MVTATINRERRTPIGFDDEDDVDNDRQSQTHLDRLYLESSQNRHPHHQYSSHTISPLSPRDAPMPINTVPVYRHGRKFYVSIEDFERMRAEERRNRRMLMQKSQNLPVSRSYQTSLRPPSASLHNSMYRSTSHPNDQRYGILRAPHAPVNSTTINNHQISYGSTRQSRSTYRYDEDQDDGLAFTSTSPIKLSRATTRSNSSDKVTDLRKSPQSSMSLYTNHVPEHYELKRSFSAELVQPPHVLGQQPQILLHRIGPSTASSYGISNVSSYPVSSTDQIYKQSNNTKSTSYFNRMQSSPLNSQVKSPTSDASGRIVMYETYIQDPDPRYTVLPSSNRQTVFGLPLLLTRSASNTSTNEYYLRNVPNESTSDDESSSPSLLTQRRNRDNDRYRRTQLVVETDDDYGQKGEVWTRSTGRSQSTDGMTEKKRVRFADMEGFTLETVSDIEHKRLPMDNLLLKKRSCTPLSSNIRKPEPSFHDSLYPVTTRIGISGSKLATDV